MSEPADILRTAPCPICRKPAVDKFRPFCSKRCADVDLNRWFGGLCRSRHGGFDEDGAAQEAGER